MEGVRSPIVFVGLVLYRCLAVASTPYDAVSSDIKPLRIRPKVMMSPDPIESL